MFIGHFAVGLGAKKAAPRVNLALLFVACQLLDRIWPVLVLLGVEKVGVDPAASVVTPFDFSYYPYSHSLVMTCIYSLAVGAIGWRLPHLGRAGVVVGLVVFSHWMLDFISHRPDLPLLFGDPKVGLGLWNSLVATVIVEAGGFAAGVWLYLKAAAPETKKQKAIFWSLIGFLLLVYAGNLFGPKPPEGTPPAAIAGPALAMWLIVVWAWFADRRAVGTALSD